MLRAGAPSCAGSSRSASTQRPESPVTPVFRPIRTAVIGSLLAIATPARPLVSLASCARCHSPAGRWSARISSDARTSCSRITSGFRASSQVPIPRL